MEQTEQQSILNREYYENQLRIAEEAWLGLGDTSQIEINNPLLGRTEDEINNPDKFLIKIIKNPDYFGFTCKHILGITLLPFQVVILQELWKHQFPMLLAARGGSKSFLLAVYCMLRMLLIPGTKIVLVGSGFRQSKIIFEYMENIWRNAPILRDIAGNDSDQGSRKEADRWYFKVGTSSTIAIPLGDGEKIRGLRANYLKLMKRMKKRLKILDLI